MGKKLLIGLVISGLVILTVGLTILFGYPSFYNKQTSLVRGSQTYQEWVKPDLPVYMRYHMFNYTNADKFIQNVDEKPILEEIGILSYREYEEKHDVEYVKSGDIVRYVSNRTYVFDPFTSTMNESDIVTVPNIVMFTVLASAPALERGVVEVKFDEWALEFNHPDLQNAVSPFYHVEAGNFLWGYENNSLLVKLEELIGGPTSFGLQSNNSNDGPYAVLTGKDNLNEKRGKIIQWYNMQSLPFYSSKYANMINGTDGEVFPVDIDKHARLYVFDSDVCRSLYVTADLDDPQNEVEGVATTKFSAPPELFQMDFEDNAAFCKGGDINNCLGDGLMDVSACYEFMQEKQTGEQMTLSIVMSLPHYLYADNTTQDTIIGFHPDKKLHETYITLNTETGVELEAAKRMQVNTQLKKYQLNSLRHLKRDWTYVVPLFWAEELLEVDSKIVHLVQESNRLSLSARILALILVAAGVMLLIGALVVVMFYGARDDDGSEGDEDETKPLLSTN
ncbi:lysosome membrane protein 2-like isoform X2 [Convolutriloba macropyga]|uniref:lysosome membrane protein 2-like isoform X2 n=1 Tax=Convolutriloba macropyga TaxID=536237 RepID=UPI003F524412